MNNNVKKSICYLCRWYDSQGYYVDEETTKYHYFCSLEHDDFMQHTKYDDCDDFDYTDEMK